MGAVALFCAGSFCATGLADNNPEKIQAAAKGTFRLMSYNIRNGNGIDGKQDLSRTAAVIRAARPAIVAVQEVDSMTGRSHQTYILGDLAKQTKMHAIYAPAIDYDGGKYGIGILTRRKPQHVRRLSLPGREEARALLIAEFKDFIFCCTHLSLTEEDRLASLEQIRKLAQESNKPFFIAGDWNDTPGSTFITQMDKTFHLLSDTTRATYPADKPDTCIDYIAGDDKGQTTYQVANASVLYAPRESDHRPIVVDIRWNKTDAVSGATE